MAFGLRRTVLLAAAAAAITVPATLVIDREVGVARASPVAGDLRGARSDRSGLRVLFIGNSLTYVNSMPALLTRLVASDPANQRIFTVQYAPGGQTLAQDVGNATVERLLDSARWNVVVLQENSNVAARSAAENPSELTVAASALAAGIRSRGARPVLFLTPGYATGSPASIFDDQAGMQDSLDRAYTDTSNALRAAIVPAGDAWTRAVQARPDVGLWLEDGVHPTVAGAYLDACVFYAFLYDRAPTSSFAGGLPPATARFLQGIAGATVGQ